MNNVISRREPREAARQSIALDAIAPHLLSHLLPPGTDLDRVAVLTAALRRFDRAQIDCAIEVLIAVLDATDGDADAETGNDLEDDFALSPMALHFARGAGCTIGDPGAQCSEDEISCGSSGIHGQGAGCALSDPGGSEDASSWDLRLGQANVVRLESARAERARITRFRPLAPAVEA